VNLESYVPGAGDQRRDRAADQGDQDKLASPSSGWPRRTRPSRSGPTRRPVRRSSPGWASCTLRCWLERMPARVPGRGQHRPSAVALREPSGKSRGRSSTPTRSKDRRRRPYAKVVITWRPTAATARLRVREQITGGRVPREYIRRWTPLQEARSSACWRLPDGRREGHADRRRYHESTPPSSRSRSPARWRSRRLRYADPVLAGAVMAVEVRTPRTTWARSSAT